MALSTPPIAPHPETRISYHLEHSAMVSLDLFNITGERVRLLQEGFLAAGGHQLMLQAEDLASGSYLLRLKSDDEQQVQRLLLLKQLNQKPGSLSENGSRRENVENRGQVFCKFTANRGAVL